MRYLSINKKEILFFFLIFFYIYNIGFVFFPGGLKTRMIIGAIGFTHILVKGKLNNLVFKSIISFGILIIFAIIIVAINNTFDFWLIQYSVLNVLYLFGAYIISYYSRNYSLNKVIKIFVFAVLIHNLLAFMGMLLHGSFQYWIVHVQKIESELINQIMLGTTRSIGFGIGNFFLGGVVSGLGLILTIYLYKNSYLKSKEFLIYFLTILLTGIFIARTTIIGLLGFLLIFVGSKKQRGRLLKITFISFSTLILLIWLIIVKFNHVINIDWAFEFILEYLKSGQIETGSTNHLLEMYIFPEKLTTWFFGEGRIINPDGSYYMGTDVGFLRLLYFGGIFCIFLFFLIPIILSRFVYLASEKNKSIKSLLVVLFIYLLVVNLKGIADFNYLYFIFLTYFIDKKVNNKELIYT